MSTPISDIGLRVALAVACLALAGCGGLGLGRPAEAPPEVAVTADSIVVTGPEGFCVDPTATRDTGGTGFVLLGNCAAIANSRRAVQPQSPAVLTAAISEPSDAGPLSESLGELDAFFRSPDGLTLLSRAGDPDSVRILETATVGDAFLLHASDSSDGGVEGVQSDYWRAYLDVGPRIATLSVLALEDRALDRGQSLDLLLAFVTAVQAANSGTPGVAVPQSLAPEQVSPQDLPLDNGPLWNVGLFRRIFG